MSDHSSKTSEDGGSSLRPLVLLSALGIVFGDIGTSPLYVLRETIGESDGALVVDKPTIFGAMSLMFWALIIVITIKYVLLVMRADNDGEGGIMALASLLDPRRRSSQVLIMLGLFGTALLYGDGMITPAISVLAAVEGIEVVQPSLAPAVLPIAIIILLGLFSIQSRGTEKVGGAFGPVMMIWFTTLAGLGLFSIAQNPEVIAALNPVYAVEFFVNNGMAAFLALGSVFLVVTGGEALYADMGHFGLGPIRFDWFAIVLPALVINYLGQSALLLREPAAIENPFYLLAPGWGRWPLTILATGATIIASQALITGAFSLTTQAINLDYLPRLRVLQTSAHERGHVYVPAVNWFLMLACIGLVLAFRTSSNLASAYGVAVTLTMVITTLLFFEVIRHRWGWSLGRSLLVVVPLLIVDTAFAAANLPKIPDGGWFPLAVGIVGFTIFTTWRTGRRLIAERIELRSVSIQEFVTGLAKKPPERHPGTGVYLHRDPRVVPPALLTNLRHNDVLHEQVVLLSIVTDGSARVPRAGRFRHEDLGLGFHQVEMVYGFVEQPDVSADLATWQKPAVTFDPDHTVYFLGRERVEVTDKPGMAPWRERLFAFLHRNAGDPSIHFGLNTDRSMDIGTHVEL